MVNVKVLGCGSSLGVPVLACSCFVCTSNNPYNRRKRSAILIQDEDTKILVDFGYDIREQLLHNKIDKLDAIISTHMHADHISGLPDLKILVKEKPIPIYVIENDFPYFKSYFQYLLDGNYFKVHISNYYDKVQINNINIQFFQQHHGKVDSLGLRFNDFVYANDVIKFPKKSDQYIYNASVFMVDCLKYESTYAHSGLDQVLKWREKFSPKKIILTNMSHQIDYLSAAKSLPHNVILAYDNMIIYI